MAEPHENLQTLGVNLQVDVAAPNLAGGACHFNEPGYFGSPTAGASSSTGYKNAIVAEVRRVDVVARGDEADEYERAEAALDPRAALDKEVPSPAPLARVYVEHNHPVTRTFHSCFDIDPAKRPTYGDLLYYHTVLLQEIYRQDGIAAEGGKLVESEARFGDLLYNGDSAVTVFTDADGTAAVQCFFDCETDW